MSTSIVPYSSVTEVRRNNPLVVNIAIPLFDYHCFRYGEALQGNQYVSCIRLNSCERGQGFVKPRMKGLLHYIRTSPVLNEILYAFDPSHVPDAKRKDIVRVQHDLLEAIAENPHIESFEFCTWSELPPRLVLSLLEKKSKSLKSVGVNLTEFGEPGTVERDSNVQELATALNAIERLETLSIDVDEGDISSLQHILQTLQQHPHLRKLVLVCDEQYPPEPTTNTICTYLSVSNRISSLELMGIRFDTDSIQNLLGTLKKLSSLQKFCFNGSFADDSTVSLFERFVRKKKTASTTTGIRDLEFGDSVSCLNMVDSLFSRRAHEDSILMSVERLQLNHQMSNLKVFGICKGSKQLVRVDLHQINEASGALLRCLPKLLYLRELAISSVEASGKHAPSAMLRALRKNGSLYRFTIAFKYFKNGPDDVFEENSPFRPYFSDNELRRVRAFCERNRLAPVMLQKPRLVSSNDDDDGEDNSATVACTTTPLDLFPPLMVAVAHAPETAFTAVFSGLLACNVAVVGSRTGEKRQADSSCCTTNNNQSGRSPWSLFSVFRSSA